MKVPYPITTNRPDVYSRPVKKAFDFRIDRRYKARNEQRKLLAMHGFQHSIQPVQSFESFESFKGHVRSPLSVGRVDVNPLFARDLMVGIHWTCGKTTSVKTSRKTAEGDSNTENEVASA